MWNLINVLKSTEQNDQRLDTKPSTTSEQQLSTGDGGLLDIISSPEKSVIDSRTLDQYRFHGEDREGFPSPSLTS